MKEKIMILDKSIKERIEQLHGQEESHRESIRRLSEEAGRAKNRLWALVYEAHPSLKGKILRIDVPKGEIIILDSKKPDWM